MDKIPKKIKFPEDESAHNNILEWWYFNGNLRDTKGNKYAFMDCLFKIDANRAKIPFLKVPFKTLYFSHSLLLDIKSKKMSSELNPVSIVSLDSFSTPLLFINYLSPSRRGYINYEIKQTDYSTYHIKTKNVELNFISTKKPLLEGGTGFVRLTPEKSSYYYSLTNLRTKGKIKIKNKWIEVEGKSWMDHQWADVSYSEDKWTWFSIQLENNIEIVCYEYNSGKNKTYLATISYPDGKQKHFSEIKLTPLCKEWKSEKTGAVYDTKWKIEIPLENITLEAEAVVKSQELVFGIINYWEGPIKIKGTFGNRKVKGAGFMELVGCPFGYTKVKFLRQELNDKIKDLKKNLPLKLFPG